MQVLAIFKLKACKLSNKKRSLLTKQPFKYISALITLFRSEASQQIFLVKPCDITE